MPDGIGLSLGATTLSAVVVGRAAVRRTPVLTLFAHRPPEVGVPSENPRLDERGLVITDFVDRVGDPVAILASDGTSHRGEALTADALRALLYALTRGRTPVDPIAVTHPAHWHPGAVDALRAALAEVPEFGPSAQVLPDATAALTALQADPGLPANGVVALCDFGGSGTSITLVDADGLRPIAPTVRHLDLSGDVLDQALLSHVVGGLNAAGAVDLSGTSAIGSLARLRSACRGAKERLSTETVTALTAELPGHSGEVRLTRAELDDVVRRPLGDFVAVLHSTLERAGVQPADLVAVATAGGGARIPIITTTLSENFRVPVVTTPRPELSAAVGAGLAAIRGPGDDDRTALAAVAPATAAAPVVDDTAESSTFRALAWSDADDIPDIAPAAYGADPAGEPDVRPQLQFGAADSDSGGGRPAAVPWYRRPPVALAIGAAAVLAALAAAVFLVNRDDGANGVDDVPASPATTTATTETPAPAPAAPPPVDTPAPQIPAPETQTVTQTAPPPAPSEAPPPPPPPTSEAPPPPPPTTTPPPATTQPPPTTTQPPRLIPTLPYTTIPGLPFVPAPPGFGG
ncbi:Hsp70 family protein [Mycolicibacterium baixiangningiae]|uniref:Hsp70 family protein n=1 Tax=Mycolicibacterium baixiangningiae TaxID=2761578 RepID=UPI0018676CA7|nr:Hsp70 family protein [Mycolicibacterium baixiangningiae]